MPPVKVLAPLSCRRPAPVFTMPPFWIGAEMFNIGAKGPTFLPLNVKALTAMA